jgi:hypothetical protein
MPQNPPKQMHTTLLIERGVVNAVRYEEHELKSKIGYVPYNDAVDKTMKEFQALERVEAAGQPFIALYYRPNSGITKEDAIAIGKAEAEKFLNPEKFRKQRDEMEELRAENARLRGLAGKGK